MSSMSKLPLRFSPEKRKWTRVGTSSSPPNKSRRVSDSKSPEPKCPICLGHIEGESFADRCFHSFCRTCLFEWSKVKAECPVCRRPFDNIIFNVESPEKYEQLKVSPPRMNEYQTPSTFTFWTNMPSTSANRYMPPHISLFSHSPSLSIRINRSQPVADFTRHFGLGVGFSIPRLNQASSSANLDNRINLIRRFYRDDLWALSDDRRTRISSASFYRDNPALTHRLQPFVYRELGAIINSEFEARTLAQRVMDAVLNYDIRSRSFRKTVENYLVANTDHFIHEFYSFATSPYELHEYDEHVIHVPRSQTTVMTTVPPVPPFGINYEVDEPEVRPPRLRTNLSRLRNTAAAESSRIREIDCIDISDDSDGEADPIVEATATTPASAPASSPTSASNPVSAPATASAPAPASSSSSNDTSPPSISAERPAENNLSINIIDDFDNPQPGPSGMNNHSKIQVNIKCRPLPHLMSFCDSDESDFDGEPERPHSFVPIFPSNRPKNDDDDDSTDSIIFLAEEKKPEQDVIDVSSDDETEPQMPSNDEKVLIHKEKEPQEEVLPQMQIEAVDAAIPEANEAQNSDQTG